MLKLLACDFGASSGRVMLGSYNGDALQLAEMHRFPNEPVIVNNTIYWDILRLFHELKRGLSNCAKNGIQDIAALGVDTWGVDFGLLDKSGVLLGNPVHYRDSRTDGMVEKACGVMPKREIYEKTGIQFMKINTLYQLLAMRERNDSMLEQAETLLLIPDLFNYFLTGIKLSEFTIATTTQMYNPAAGAWAADMLHELGLPTHMLTPVVSPASLLGPVSEAICRETNIRKFPVVSVAEHDTGSAVVSVPAAAGSYAYLSCGTWSLVGIESQTPIINDNAFTLDYTNEGGAGNTYRVLKNIVGLWIYQECSKDWSLRGDISSYDELESMAGQAQRFLAFIDPDDAMFSQPGNMPDKIREFCIKTGQKVPEGKGAVVRCILESLAFKYRMAVEGLDQIAGERLPVIHIVGGGARNTLLCSFTANATGRRVAAGPVEATSVGNIACQLIALGELKNIAEARRMIGRSFETSEYLPDDVDAWEEAFSRFKKVIEIKRSKESM